MHGLIALPVSAVSVFLSGALAPGSAAAQDESELVLKPISVWHASYEEGRCRLTRSFGAPSSAHALVLEQRAPGAKFNMILTGPALSGIKESGEVRITFGPDGYSADHAIARDSSEKLGPLVYMQDVGIVADEPADGAAGPSVGMGAPSFAIDTAAAKPLRKIVIAQGKQTLVFVTGGLAVPLGVLNDCTAHILETWGLDPEAHRNAQRPTKVLDEKRVARGILESYPSRAVQEGRQGVVGVAVMVDETGQPTECKITRSSGHVELNAVSCKLLMKARYDPALGADGQPMKSYWVTRITFRLG